MIELPETIRPYFIACGWHPQRQAAVSSAVPADHPAAAILAAFGGLTIARPEDDEGEECGLDDLQFRETWQPDYVALEWSKLLETKLIGIADIHFGHGLWFAAEDGRIFGYGVNDAFWYAGESFAEAAERSLLGRRVRPLLGPGKTSTMLYGKTYTASSPELYRDCGKAN